MNIFKKIILFFMYFICFCFSRQAFGKSYTPKDYYREPAALMKFFKPVQPSVITPAFYWKRDSFTSQDEMMNYITDAAKSDPNIKIEIIGTSQNKKAIPLVIFAPNGVPDPNKITIWLQGMVHGDEPGGGESLLALIGKISGTSYGKEILKNANLLIVPRVNPDGAENFRKSTASGKDINGDFVDLLLPETKALAKTFNRYAPQVALDFHEYVASPGLYSSLGEKGVLPYEDIMLLHATNSNIDPQLTDISKNIFVKGISRTLLQKNFSSGFYYNDVLPKKNNQDFTLVMAGPYPVIGRNYYGLNSACSLLIESRGRGIGWTNFSRRIEALLTAADAAISISIENKDVIMAASKNARNFKKPFTSHSSKPVIKNTMRTFIDLSTNSLKSYPVKEKWQ